MKIALTSVLVDDQDRALKFYTEALGFLKKTETPAGKFKWLTVVSPEAPDGTQLLLEPNENAAAKTYQRALFAAGIPLTSFAVPDVQLAYEKLTAAGVVFRVKPTTTEWGTNAVFEDTCGNLIGLHEE